jgi:pimeloyl-ACP methyl ester carboxylesterase
MTQAGGGVSRRGYEQLGGGVRLHFELCGSGPLVVLLHGFPETARAWRRVADELATSYTVLTPDLRGFGYSSRPLGGYDADTVAGDVLALVERLGFSAFAVCGHDWGALVAYACAALGRSRVRALALLDGPLPGFGVLEGTAAHRFHVTFHSLPDLPEALIGGRERTYLEFFFFEYAPAADPGAIEPSALDEYVNCMRRPGGIRSSIGYYRAMAETAEQFRRHAASKLTVPVIAWGADSPTGGLTLEGARRVAADVTGGIVPGCGHWIPEERPDFAAARLRALVERIW